MPPKFPARSGHFRLAVQVEQLKEAQEARKLVRLVDELLLLAAGQENKLKVHREPTDVAALVDQLGAAWRPAAEQRGWS